MSRASKMVLGALLLANSFLIGVKTALAGNSFNILTYNIHSLPEIKMAGVPILGNRENVQDIASKLCGFDLVLIQEDFWLPELSSLDHCYDHSYLSSRNLDLEPKDFLHQIFNRDDHFRLGSGLTQFSNLEAVSNQTTPWDDCSGYGFDANDCLAWKGFSHTVVKLSDGVVADIYNLHYDAGNSKYDREARQKQSAQLIAHVNQRSPDHLLVIAGDFNAFVEEEGLASLRRQLNLREACATLGCGERRIDKVFFRSSQKAKLIPRQWSTYDAVQGLSDHDAIAVEFEWLRFI